jgi:hypothetical protein
MHGALDLHALAEAATEFDGAALLVAQHVLDQERHAAERTVAQRRLVEPLDPVGIGLDHGVDGGVGGLDGAHGGGGDLARRNFAPGDQFGEAQRIKAGVFGEVHCGLLRWFPSPSLWPVEARRQSQGGHRQKSDRSPEGWRRYGNCNHSG